MEHYGKKARFFIYNSAKFRLKRGLKFFSAFCVTFPPIFCGSSKIIMGLFALIKIEVKGFEVKNFRGTDSYLYLEQIVLSGRKPPRAKIEFEISYKKSIFLLEYFPVFP